MEILEVGDQPSESVLTWSSIPIIIHHGRTRTSFLSKEMTTITAATTETEFLLSGLIQLINFILLPLLMGICMDSITME